MQEPGADEVAERTRVSVPVSTLERGPCRGRQSPEEPDGSGLRIEDATNKQDRPGWHVPDDVEERLVGPDDVGLRRPALIEPEGGRGGGYGPVLVDGDVGGVNGRLST